MLMMPSVGQVYNYKRGTLTEVECSVRLTSLYKTSLDWVLLYDNLICLFAKQVISMWRSTVLTLPLQLVFLATSIILL
jgi:hypothetical protein